MGLIAQCLLLSSPRSEDMLANFRRTARLAKALQGRSVGRPGDIADAARMLVETSACAPLHVGPDNADSAEL